MADPNNWTDGRSSQTSAGGPAGYQQLGQPSGQFGTLGPPKANTMPTSVSNPGQMTAQQFSVPQANQSPPYAGHGGGVGQRPPGPQPGVQFRPPGHMAAGSWQPSSATPPPGQPAGLMQTGIPRSSSSPSVPGPNQGPGGAPAMVNGLPHGPHRPPTPLNGQLQAPPGVNQSGQQYTGVPPPPASRQNQGGAPMPAVSKQVQSTTSNPLQPTGAYQPQPNVSSATMARSTPPVGGPAIRAPPPSQGPQTGQMFNSRPNELPLPYHGHGQYSHQVSGLASSATPGLTPNNSEPPSQRSSRAPSPVSGQKYDALEGQFSPQGVSGSVQDGKQSISQPMQFSQPTRPAVPAFGHQQAPRPQWMMNQPSEPTRYTSQPGQGMSGQQPSHPPAVSGRPPPPSGMAGQPPPPLGHAGQPPPQLGMAGQPPPPTGLTGQPPPPPGVAGQHPPSWGVTGQPPLQPGVLGQPPPQVGGLRQPAPPVSGQPPPPPGASGEAPLPPTVSAQYTTPPATSGQMPSAGSTGITGPRHYPQMAPTSMPGPDALSKPAVPTYSVNSTSGGSAQPGTVYPANSTHSHTGNPARLSSSFSNMRLQPDNQRPVNLLQERDIIPPEGVELPRPDLPAEYRKANCSPDIFRCTLNSIPNTESLLNKSRLPLGILIHPFKDLAEDEYPVIDCGEGTAQLPVIQSSVIVRCRSCRTYINPFVTFVDSRRWKCNLCYRNNELPEEFNYDPVSRTYGEPQRRPEVKSGTIEFIAPSEYMLRPPQPAAYLFVLDVSFNAKGTGYLQAFCQTLLDELDRLPGDARTQIGFIAFDRSLYYFNIGEGLSQPQLLVVSDIEEVFLPSPDNLLVNLNECKDLVIELLNILPDMFKDNLETGSALGPAIEAAFKLLASTRLISADNSKFSPTGGRISVFQTQLPTVGNGALKSREDPNERSGKKIQHLGPATDFYKQLALNCSAQQVAVDLFMFNSQYADIASIACVSKYSGGSLYYFPGYHNVTNPTESDRFEGLLKRYLTRKIGFEAVMRIRCSRGLSIHTFHGNFFVRSTDLLSLPNVNPDAGFGMQMSIEDTIEANYVCFQAALLYTSSKGERRIRVHTLAVPVAKTLSEVHAHADQQAIIGLLAKMGVDRSLTASMSDARDAMINAVKDMLNSYGNTLTSSQRVGQLPCAYSLRLQPLYTLALLKSMAFRVGSSTKLDDRVYAMEQCKNLPLCYLMLMLYPNMYPLHSVDENRVISKGDLVIPQLPVLQLSSAHMDRHGVYLLDAGSHMIIWVGAAISDQFCQDVFDRPQFSSLPDAMLELPDQDNETSDLIRTFITHLNDQRPYPATLLILREDSRSRYLFLQYMIEDHTESTMSYYEFLQHLQKEIKS